MVRRRVVNSKNKHRNVTHNLILQFIGKKEDVCLATNQKKIYKLMERHYYNLSRLKCKTK